MIRMFVRHSVADFAQWKQVYDDFDAKRKGMGVTGDAVFNSVDNPNDVTLWHDFESIQSARDFVESEPLREAMSKAGVTGQPDIWFTQPA